MTNRLSLSPHQAAEGLQLARELLPEVIILDVLMQGMDGWSVLVALKTTPELGWDPSSNADHPG